MPPKLRTRKEVVYTHLDLPNCDVSDISNYSSEDEVITERILNFRELNTVDAENQAETSKNSKS